MKKNTKLWIGLLLIGFLGQLAWVLENMYFNVFVYETISKDVNVIARMVSLSAITATVTTLFMGALSDKVGKRKVFICFGYVLWGLSLMAFAFLKLDNIARFFPDASAIILGGWLAVIMDCIMTFFGSTANDACFNAWVTDVTDSSNRAKVESVLATLPLIAMLLVFGLLDGMTKAGNWSGFFLLVGSLVSIGGIIGSFFIDEPQLEKRDTSYLSNITYGFKPSVIKSHNELYLSMLCLLVFSISTQIFMPYMIIYITNYLGITDYALILGIVLLGASIISVLAGRVISIIGDNVFFVPSIILLTVGLLGMFVVRGSLGVVIMGLVMMSGNLIVTSIVNASIRNYTPTAKAGQFQGVRMIFGVMLPMIIGPYIGTAVIKGSKMTYEELGEIKYVPNEYIWLAAAIVALLTIIPYIFLKKQQDKRKNEHRDLSTPFGEKLDKNAPVSEYPRPQLIRDSYLNLNGYWDYAIKKQKTIPDHYDGKILVPFVPESILSEVQKSVKPDDILYYHRTFRLPEGFNKGLVHLNFGAVDQQATIYLNGKKVGEHEGGYLPFSLNITPYLKQENDLVVEVRDVSDTSYHSRGKQSFNRGGIWYTPSSGIWQTVWLESTPENYIESVKITPDYDHGSVNIKVKGNSKTYTYTINDEITVTANNEVTIKLNNFIPWSPENPYLYSLTITNGEDRVDSYFAMRKVTKQNDKSGYPRIFLNDEPYFCKGVLDQGYWSDSLYTPVSDEAIIHDIQTLKDMGFNTIRKHIKIEPLRWYYYCDKLGMLVWQDMVNGGEQYSFMTIAALPFINVKLNDHEYKKFARQNETGRREYCGELRETIDLLYNTPSIIVWVPFNEGWGQFDSLEITSLIKELDPTRLIDHASGWHDQGGGDFNSLHIYFSNIDFKQDNRITAISEYGGYSWLINEHSYNDAGYGYKLFKDQNELQEAFKQLHLEQIKPLIEKGLSALIYTQVSDVEDEVNGLMTYDRKVTKFDKDFVKEIMDSLEIK